MEPLIPPQQPAATYTRKHLMALSAFFGGLVMLSFSLNRRGAHTIIHSTGNTVRLQILKPVKGDELPTDLSGDPAPPDSIYRREGDNRRSAVYFEGVLMDDLPYIQALAMLRGWNEYLIEVEKHLEAYRCREAETID